MEVEHGKQPLAGRVSSRRFLIACVFGALGIALGARLTVPMEPVPMTLQTLAVLLAGGLGGWRVGAGAGLLYLVSVVCGAPILANGAAAAGPDFLELKSAGYVVGFVPAGALAGLGPRTRRGPGSVLWILALMLAAHALLLLTGFGWLARSLGAGSAWKHGIEPFLMGALAKSVFAAAAVARARRLPLHA